MQLFPRILVAAAFASPFLGPAAVVADTDLSARSPPLGISASTGSVPVLPSTVELTVGFAEILRVEGTVSTIVLGEPAIADASPLDAGTILLTGRTAGTTNLIALDEAGQIIADLMLHVGSRQPGSVTVRRALDVQVYSCVTGLCDGSFPSDAAEAAPVADAAPASTSP